MSRYYVKAPEAGEHWGPYTRLLQAQDFARIGSQHGGPREVRRGKVAGKLVRRYVEGDRVWPTTKRQLQGLQPGEIPRDLRGEKKVMKKNSEDVNDFTWWVAIYIWQNLLEWVSGEAVEEGQITPKERDEFLETHDGTAELDLSMPPWVLEEAQELVDKMEEAHDAYYDEIIPDLVPREAGSWEKAQEEVAYYAVMQWFGNNQKYPGKYGGRLLVESRGAIRWAGAYDATFEYMEHWIKDVLPEL